MNGPRIVWLAAADARGHLVRGHLARGLLARRGVTADIVTTHEDGRRFLAALGTPSEVLSPHYGVAFDEWQNMDRRRTEATILRYFLQPSRGLQDLLRLGEVAEGAAYVVNDFRGADTAEMAPSFADALLPPALRWVGRAGPLSPLAVLACASP